MDTILSISMYMMQSTQVFLNSIKAHITSFGEGVGELYQNTLHGLTGIGWHITFLSLWKDFETRFEIIIDFLQTQEDFLCRDATSFSTVEATESRTKSQDEIQWTGRRKQELVEETERNRKRSQLQDSISWLSADEELQQATYGRIFRSRYGNTCEWILYTQQWKDWIEDDSKSSCLWLNGKPGSGKGLLNAESCSLLMPIRQECHLLIHYPHTNTKIKSYRILLLL